MKSSRIEFSHDRVRGVAKRSKPLQASIPKNHEENRISGCVLYVLIGGSSDSLLP